VESFSAGATVDHAAQPKDQPAVTMPATFADATRVFARIGLLSFGGPAG
jgi:hypothetical protein